MSAAKDAGDRGEAAAAEYLRRRGYEILASQWHCRFGELDLVARSREGILCFVEVKLRRSGSMALPREYVDSHKQARLRKTALAYLAGRGLDDVPARFDVAEVYEERDGSLRVVYLEDAFQ